MLTIRMFTVVLTSLSLARGETREEQMGGSLSGYISAGILIASLLGSAEFSESSETSTGAW